MLPAVAFGYTHRRPASILLNADGRGPGIEAVGSMGNDTPPSPSCRIKPAVALRLLQTTFRSGHESARWIRIREEAHHVDGQATIGAEYNLLDPETPLSAADQIKLELADPDRTMIWRQASSRLDNGSGPQGFKTKTLSIALPRQGRLETGLEKALDHLFDRATDSHRQRRNDFIILSDRGHQPPNFAPIPSAARDRRWPAPQL